MSVLNSRAFPDKATARRDVEERLTDRVSAILMRRDVSGMFGQGADTAPSVSLDNPAVDADEWADADASAAEADSMSRGARRPQWKLAAFGAGLAACAAIGVWMALPVPEAPAQVRIGLSLDNVQDAAERLSLLRSEAQAMVAPDNLSRVVERARLDRDPEFSGQPSGGLAILTDMVVGGPAAGDGVRVAQNRLRAALTTQVDPRENAILLTVRTDDAAKSDSIAQEIAASYAEAAAQTQVRHVDLAETPAPAIATQQSRDAAQAQLDAFIAAGGDKVAEAMRIKTELDRLRIENAAAQKRLLEESGKGESGTLASLLDGTFPLEYMTPGLEDLRNRYAAARFDAEQLAQALGPRHPRLVSAQAIADGLKTDIEREIRGIFADARASLQSAQEKAQTLTAKSAEALRKLRKTGIDVEKLETLQAAVRQADDERPDTITTAGIPAAASAPPAAMVEQVEKMPVAAGEPLGVIAGLLAVLACALGTGAAVLGLSRLTRRKWVSPAEGSRRENAQVHERQMPEPAQPRAADPVETRAASLQEDLAWEDIARLRQEVAALKRRVQDFSDRHYRHQG